MDAGDIRDLAERVMAGTCLVFLSPLLGSFTLLIRATSVGPALYVSPRLGKAGHIFLMKKFRSMVADAPTVVSTDAKTVVEENDPRFTAVGRFLRIGFDELPQLLNIAAGDMRFIGPRPDATWMEPRYTETIRKRLRVKPGVVGLAQVLDARNLPTRYGYMLDVYYAEHRCISLDALILGLTPLYVAGWKSVGAGLLARILEQEEFDPDRYEPTPSPDT